MKNTILGIVVFEVYGAIVDTLIPAPSVASRVNEKAQASNAATTAISTLTDSSNLFVPISIHSLGGFMGGASHGVVATVWDSITNTTQHKHPIPAPFRFYPTMLCNLLNPAIISVRQHIPGMIAHHGLSHAVLFGSYELSKRLIFAHWIYGTRYSHHRDDDNYINEHHVKNMNHEPMVKVEYLAYIFLAGGIAGQAQHISSHFTEKWFLLNSYPAFQSWRTILFSLVMSSFPSGIAFVALEYGRSTEAHFL